MNLDEIFWSSNIEEMKNGYKYQVQNNSYICIICGEQFIEGNIYSMDNELLDAEHTIKKHILKGHKSVFNYLLNQKMNGLSELQKNIMKCLYDNQSDKEIAIFLGNKANSTIRNHRFVLREKYKEAKIFIALMDIIEKDSNRNKRFVHFHDKILVDDARIMTTEEERDNILEKYLEVNDNNKIIKRIPKKQKDKIIILQWLSEKFDRDKYYNEKDVNKIINNYFSDHATLRRYLIDFGFMDRTKSGNEYWIV